MKYNNDNIDMISLANDDYDEIEEETIERDEYSDEYEEDGYDEEGEYAEEEPYEEEYPEEEYDDEEVYDEEYEDEQYDEEQPYDEEYDDKLNQVLDELADLKRGMNSPALITGQPQPMYSQPQPSVPYVYTNNTQPHNSGNEVVMYNEISRLRDELSKTQNSQNLHIELTRLKEDMSKENKQNENAFLNEIKHLNEKIENLQKAPDNSTSVIRANNYVAPRENLGTSNIDFTKLLEINEAILMSSKEIDGRIQREIGQIKQQLSVLPNFDELNKSVSMLRKSIKPDDETSKKNLAQMMNELTELRKTIKESGIFGVGQTPNDDKISERIDEIKLALSDKSTDNSEIIRQIYELKSTLGSANLSNAKHNANILALYNELSHLKFDVNSNSNTVGDKISAVIKFSRKLAGLQETDINEIVAATNDIINNLNSYEVDKRSFENILNLASSGELNLSPIIKEYAAKFLELVSQIKAEDVTLVADLLPQVIELKNQIQNFAEEMQNEEIYSSIMNLNADLLFATDDNKSRALKQTLSNLVARLTALKVADVVKISKVNPAKVYKSYKIEENQGLFDKINELKNTIAGVSIGASQNDAGSNAIADEISSLKTQIFAATQNDDIINSINDLRMSFIDISSQFADVSQLIQDSEARRGETVVEEGIFTNNDISNQIHDIRDELVQSIHDETTLAQDTLDLRMQEVIAACDNELSQKQLIDDLIYIKTKLDDHETFITQISDLRSELLSFNPDLTPQVAKLYEDVSAQIDKLYEDITTVYAESEEKHSSQIDAIKASVESLGANINNDALLDFCINLRDDIDALKLKIIENDDVALNDRVKLLEDISFIRAQIEDQTVIEDAEIAASQDVIIDENMIYGEILDLKTRIFDDLQLIQDKVITLELAEGKEDALKTSDMILSVLGEIKERLNERIDQSEAENTEKNIEILEAIDSVKDLIDIVAANSSNSLVLSDLSDLKQKNIELSEAINNINLSYLDNQNILLDELAALREQFVGNEKESATVLEDTIINTNATYLDSQNVILGELAAIKEQILTGSTNGIDEIITTANNSYLDNQSIIIEEINQLKEKIGLSNSDELTQSFEQTVQDNSAAVLDAQNLILDEIAAIKEQVIPIIRDNKDGKSAILSDEVFNITGKIADIQKQSAENTQKLFDEILNIKEQIHLKELEQSLSSVVATEEEQQTLLKEISVIRERLSDMENSSRDLSDTSMMQMNLVMDQLTDLNNSLNDKPMNESIANNNETILSVLDEINQKLSSSDNETFDSQNIQDLMGDVAEIKEKVLSLPANVIDFDKIVEDLAYVRNQIEQTLDEGNSDQLDENIANEDIALIMEDLSAIKEKLGALDEYDTISEILALREDLKTARIVDQNDVSGELELLKNELLDLKNEIYELKSLKSDISLYRDEVSAQRSNTTSEFLLPTNDEVNMLLSEIVSLRDEVQSYKDEMTNLVTNTRPEEILAEDAVPDENITIILDELTSLRAEFAGFKEEEKTDKLLEANELKTNILELKDIISRRTSIVENQTETGVSSELNVVLDEIINLKEELGNLRELSKNNSDERLNAVYDEIFNLKTSFNDKKEEENSILMEIQGIKEFLSEPAEDLSMQEPIGNDSLLTEIQAFKDELYGLFEEKIQEIASLNPTIDQDLQIVKNQLSELQLNQAMNNLGTGAIPENNFAIKTVLDEIEALKNEVINAQTVDNSSNEVLGQIQELRCIMDELKAYKPQPIVSQVDENISYELSSLKDEILQLKQSMDAEKQESDLSILTEIMSLRDEITAIKQDFANVALPPDNSSALIMEEISSLKETIMQSSTSQLQANESDISVLTEVMAIRDEMERLKGSISAKASNGVDNLYDTIEIIQKDIQTIKDEPDLSIISEVMALRDEFQGFKDELNKKNKILETPKDEKPHDDLINEVQTLRDQLFAISMANINDGTNSDVVYESYNNIILDELSSLRDEVAQLKNSDKSANLSEEIGDIKNSFANFAVDEREQMLAQLKELRVEIGALKKADINDATNNAILTELANLKMELENQREADATTLNFMSEMAYLLERQNQYINQSSNSKISDEIESLKQEIASSRPSQNFEASQIMNEIAKLKEEISQSLGEPVVIDNKAIVAELAKLKEELSTEKPSAENQLILHEISRLKDEISAFAEKEKEEQNEEGLSKSIHELKSELNDIADFVSEDRVKIDQKSTAPKKTNKTGNKTTAKKTQSKTQSKASTKKKVETSNVSDELSTDELLSKIEATSIEIPKENSLDAIFNGAMNIEEVQSKNTDDLDIASKLAKQVANKLIMEQLVQQLGDGGVPRSKVEEIVKDILPQEFTTIQIDEQSDQVRRLANSLVLDKLRSRLTGKK